MDFSKFRHYLFLALLAGVTVVFIFIIRPFAYPLLWAAIIAGLFYPVYKRLNRYLRRPNLSSALVLVLTFFIIVLPIAGISSLVVKESLDLYSTIDSNRSQIGGMIQGTLEWIKNNPYTASWNVDEAFWTEKFAEGTKVVTSFLLVSAKNFTQNSFVFVVMMVIMFYALFFFLRDGQKLLRTLMHLCPLGDRYEALLYDKFVSMARAMLKGTLIVGIIQGALGWILFAALGIQGAAIWGLLMIFFALIPGIGPMVIWIPAAIIMFAVGNVWQAVVIVAVGALIIGTIDNILRPMLVSKDMSMHPLLVLFSTLGGIVVFGISGFVIGPIITALLLAFWEMYEEYYKTELEHN